MQNKKQIKNISKRFCVLLLLNLFLFFPSVYSLDNNTHSLQGKIVSQGIIEAFVSEQKNTNDVFTFEPSAVYKVADQYYLINDRPLPKNFPSQIISFSEKHLAKEVILPTEINKVEFPLINDSNKIEATTQSLDNSFTFASTSFTYFSDEDPKKDKYNRIIYWPYKEKDQAKIINPSARQQGFISSIQVRREITKSLKSTRFPKGPDYFKIEGLSYAPGDKLLFGIRSMGNSYNDSTYQFILIEAQILFSVDNNGEQKLELANFNKVYQPSAKQLKFISQNISQSIGVSSIEYDKNRKGFFVLTSFEKGSSIGAYLWFYRKSQAPSLILNQQGKPLVFDHKAEGLFIMENGQLLVIHDDDRETKMVSTGQSFIKRKTNQGIYSIVQLSTTAN